MLNWLVVSLLTVISCQALAADQSLTKRQQSSVGIGLNGIADWSTQFPFLDQMKMSREWYDWARDTAEGIETDEHGWIISMTPGLRPETVFLTNSEDFPVVYSHYIVRWQGKGQVNYGGCAQKVGTAYGGDRIKVGQDSCFLAIEAVDESDPIRSITIVPEKHIAAFDRGEIFNPDFIEKISQFRAIRFMDWMVTNGSKQSRWGERSRPNDRTFMEKGVPIELMVALANKIDADPWFNMPHLADLDYIKAFATYVKENLNADLVSYVEHSNEVWNWIFPQAQHALKMSKTLFNDEGDGFFQWHGMRTAQICDIWKQEVFVGQTDKVMCVLGTQGGWPGLENPALDCPLWAKQGNKPCYQHGFDAIAITGYFSGCLDGGEKDVYRRKIIGWYEHDKDKGLKRAAEQIIDGRHFECEDSLDDVKKTYKYFVKQAKKRGLVVLAYEGGQHVTSNLGATQDDERFTHLHMALNRDIKMTPLYKKNFENWKEAGGTLFMHFVDAASYNKHGSWGALEYITQETSPKWEALTEFNKTPCWWQGCQTNKQHE